MMFRSLAILSALSAAKTTTTAFQPVTHKATHRQSIGSSSSLNLFWDSNANSQRNSWASLGVAGAIFASTLAGSMAVPAPAGASVELSEGAIIVQTNSKPGQSVLKAEVDVKDLVGTVIKNRKELKESVGRITSVIKEELASPAVVELSKEILQIEGDVAPEFLVSPPRDFQQTLRDISKGKLNLIVNGEIINLSIDKTSSEGEDEIVIRAKGVRGVGPIAFNEPAVTQVRTRLQDQLDAVRDFWYAPIPLPESIQEKLGFQVDTGTAILAGSTVFVGSVYGVSYAYYLSEQEKEAKAAEEKRKQMAAKKKGAAAQQAKVKSEKEMANDEETE